MVFVKEGDIEKAIKAFRLEYERSDTAKEVKQQQCFVKPSEGWETLGYKIWQKCVVAEFTNKKSYLYYQLAAAKTERNISTIVENKIPEGQLRPLTHLEPEQQREVWQKAQPKKKSCN